MRDQENAKSLIAFVLKRSNKEIDELNLSKYLKERLPSYSCPARISILTEWPLTARGKVDRTQLLKNLHDPVDFGVAVNTPTEGLAAIWCDLLGLSRVGPQSHFFELGGHSLLAMTLVGRVNERWDVGLTLRQVIEEPRFDAMAHRLRNAQRLNDQRPTNADTRPQPTSGPLSYGQQTMLVIDRMNAGDSSQYNVAFGLHLFGKVDDRALQSALNYVIERQGALRTFFEWNGSLPQQRIAKNSITLIKEIVTYEDYLQIATQDARCAHDLLTAPPLRVRHFEIIDRSAESVLYFNLHHIIHDGISIDILVREWTLAYEAHLRGIKPALPKLRESYLDYASSIIQPNDMHLEESIAFWRNYLKDSTPLTLNVRKQGYGDPLQGGCCKIMIDAEDLRGLRARCRHHNANLSATLLAAVFYALRPWTVQQDYTVGSVVSVREHAMHENLIGMFVNTILLRNTVRIEASLADNIASIQQALLDILPHRQVPLSKLVDELHLPRDTYEHKVFDVMVNYHAFGNLFHPLPSSALQTELKFVENNTTNTSLGIDFYDWGEQSMQVRISYCENIYDTKQVVTIGQEVRKWVAIFASREWHAESVGP
jgi:hypothetical protein